MDEVGSAGVRRRGVLVVDDDGSVRQLLHQALQLSGFEVWSAEDGREALDVLQERGAITYLVITDMRMPRMSGAELGREIAQRYPHIQVLYTSAFTDEEIPLGSPFLPKPFGLSALMREVDRLLPPLRNVHGA